MTKIDKLWAKFQGSGKATYPELVRLMAHYGFEEFKSKGSGRKFVNKNGLQFAMHEPHPSKELKFYQKNGAKKFIYEYLKSTKK